MCDARLALRIRGGLSNQRECIVNAGIAAHALGLPLVLPRLELIGRGNERFAPEDAHYVHPWNNRGSWGAFGQLYDTHHATETLRQLVPLVRMRGSNGKERPQVVSLPPVEQVVPGCGGAFHQGGNSAENASGPTCEPRAADRTLLDALLKQWKQVVTSHCPRQLATDAGPAMEPSPLKRPAVVFSAGQSLCWNAYKSRHAAACKRHFVACGPILRSLQWSQRIASLQERVVAHLRQHRLAAEAAARGQPAWVAVHVRAFICATGRRKTPSFGHVLDKLRQLGLTSGLVYLVSSVPLAEVQAALPTFTVLSKQSVLGDARRDYPFEVCAAIDYGVAVAAPLYLGEPGPSSFDAFADEERRRANRSAVRRVAGACA